MVAVGIGIPAKEADFALWLGLCAGGWPACAFRLRRRCWSSGGAG